MKNSWLGLVLLSSHVATLAANLPPLVLRDKGKIPVRTTREVHIPDLRKLDIQSSVPCTYKYEDKYFGYLDDDWYYRQGKMPFQSVCYDAKSNVVQRGWAEVGADGSTWQPNLSNEEKRKLKGAFHFYRLKAVNASGWAVTVNDTIGDEEYRARRLYYCLIRPPAALCGHGDMGYLSDGRKGDLTHYSLQILRSIEFIDDAAPTTSKETPAVRARRK